MNTTEKNKLKHDFLNSIVIINSMTKSASSFLNKLPQVTDSSNINEKHDKQMEKFSYSMSIIREQTVKIESYFQILLNE